MPAGRGVAVLAGIPDGQCRDGFPEPMIRREHAMVAMPMFLRRWDQIGELVQKLDRRELNHAARAGPRGLAAAAGPAPVGDFVSGQQLADAGDAAACVTCHGEPLERKRRPGAIPQHVFQKPRCLSWHRCPGVFAPNHKLRPASLWSAKH